MKLISLKRPFASLLVALALLAGMSPVTAGRSCEARKLSAAQVERSLQLAERAFNQLQASGDQVVFLARAGQDLSRYKLRYSHLGIAYLARDAQGQPVWRVLHKLNHCGTAHAALYRQGLGDFFLDDLWRLEAAWVVPAREVQDRLLVLLRDERRAIALNHRPYSIVSYAWGRTYQQSNQWAIETLAMAMEPGIATREAAQAWLMFKGYQPTALQIGPLTRLGGRVGSANVAFDDHPNEKRFANRIETVTVDSVFTWLRSAGLTGEIVRLTP